MSDNNQKTSSKGIFDEIEEEEARLGINNIKTEKKDEPDYLLIVLFVVMIVVLMFSNSFFQNVFSDSSPGGGAGIALIIFGPFVAAIAVIAIVGFLVALCANISTNSKKEKENTIESNQETKEENNN